MMVAVMIAVFLLVHNISIVNAQSVFGSTPTSVAPRVPYVASTPSASAQVTDLESALQKKRKDIETIQKKIAQYQNDIERQRGRSITLQNELSALRSRLEAAELRIDETKQKISLNALERKTLDAKLDQTRKELDTQKTTLGRLLRLLNSEQEQSLMVVMFKEPTLSSYYDALQGTLQLRDNINTLIERRQKLLQTYQLQQAAVAQKYIDLQQLDRELKDRSLALGTEQVTKDVLLTQTRNSERNFQQLLQQARAEQLQADAQIRSLETSIRERLRERGLDARLSPDGAVSFVWPVPNQGIAAYFHDPNYPFRNVFEHPAIDIRTLIGGKSSNGLPVRAASSGYVARAQDGGATGYSYIMLIHNNQFSTVYGHVSQINVAQDEFVTQGQVIGLSGGAPGTHGAGRLTTGPHLHFEVRKNGIPVNPLDYLP